MFSTFCQPLGQIYWIWTLGAGDYSRIKRNVDDLRHRRHQSSGPSANSTTSFEYHFIKNHFNYDFEGTTTTTLMVTSPTPPHHVAATTTPRHRLTAGCATHDDNTQQLQRHMAMTTVRNTRCDVDHTVMVTPRRRRWSQWVVEIFKIFPTKNRDFLKKMGVSTDTIQTRKKKAYFLAAT